MSPLSLLTFAMATNDPGLAPLGASDPRKGISTIPSDDEVPVAPDQSDERYETTREETWAYYLYVIVDSHDRDSHMVE